MELSFFSQSVKPDIKVMVLKILMNRECEIENQISLGIIQKKLLTPELLKFLVKKMQISHLKNPTISFQSFRIKIRGLERVLDKVK